MAIADMEAGRVRMKREMLHARSRLEELEQSIKDNDKNILERKALYEQALNTKTKGG